MLNIWKKEWPQCYYLLQELLICFKVTSLNCLLLLLISFTIFQLLKNIVVQVFCNKLSSLLPSMSIVNAKKSLQNSNKRGGGTQILLIEAQCKSQNVENFTIKNKNKNNPFTNITLFEFPCKEETILCVSSMNFFLPLTEKTPTPNPLKQTASSWGATSLTLRVLAWISCKTFGISILGCLFRFKEQEKTRFVGEHLKEEGEASGRGSLSGFSTGCTETEGLFVIFVGVCG